MRILSPLVVLFSLVVSAQSVSNIKAVEQDGKIAINYQISESNSQQFFTVSIICKTPTKNITPVNITGDVGKWIEGGKSEYTAIWDVFSDIDELDVAEFIVQIKGMNAALRKHSKTRYILTNSGLGFTPYGFQFGIHSSWGGQVSARYGNDGFYNSNDNVVEVPLYSITLGPSKRIYQTFNSELHVYVSAGYARWGKYTDDNTTTNPADSTNGYQTTMSIQNLTGNDDFGVEINAGIIGRFKSFGYTLGMARNCGEYDKYSNLLIGVGYVF